MKKLLFLGAITAISMIASDTFDERDFANLTDKEKKDLDIAQKWINRRTTTTAGKHGEVVFLFGEAMPSIVTAPLRLTDISLQPGEIIKDVQIGDSVRWIVSLSISGEEPETVSHVIVKPTDVNLQTTLNIMTNRRTYHINLISGAKNFIPAVSFHYQDDITKSLKDYQKRMKEKSQSKDFYKTGDDRIPTNIENLDFGYSI